LASGWSVHAACQELVIGRSTGHIWRNGTVVRRKDGTVNIVPPLEPLAVRTISRQQDDEAGSGTVTAL
jgi:IS30 family transposase